ncbi:cytochrome c [Pseudomonas putida]|uniref:c-type cytochrome n=1 Tax=Pseudomonas putida TaxID=303 RepID=UPI002169F840|nr:cytochrome c [Pseudomonas putida]MCS4063775.1 mono/diheme cytochrome c family protein [Pseudomonas putida]
MKNWKKIATGTALVAGLAAVGVAWIAVKTFDTSRSAVADDTVPLAQFRSTDQAAIVRGEYVMRLGDCAACHKADFAGGYKIDTPFGSLLTSNITPDTQTGIGAMTERDFFNAVRQGIGSHGLLYPAMPYTAYTKLNDRDMHDLWSYLSTIAPVNKPIDENAGMHFPYNVRLAMAGWDMLFFDNTPFIADVTQGKDWNRGKYLTDGPAHCGTCHTPRNLLGGERSSAYLQGGRLGAWYAPDITPNPLTGIGHWSVDTLTTYLKTGSDDIAVAAGPMAEAVEHSFQYYKVNDLDAIGSYLKSLPASPAQPGQPMTPNAQRMKAAALTYEVNCSACHGLEGEGIKGMVTAFAGNRRMLTDDPTNLLHAMLMGARAPHTEARQTAAGMPSFAWKMNDQQVAEILNYVRNSWGNAAVEVRPEQVAELRGELGAHQKLAVPEHVSVK